MPEGRRISRELDAAAGGRTRPEGLRQLRTLVFKSGGDGGSRLLFLVILSKVTWIFHEKVLKNVDSSVEKRRGVAYNKKP
jgi:hypothetical protein